MTPVPMLSLQQIDFSYDPGQPVLEGISCDIQPGTINAILGSNGAGKSTLLHLILGLYRPHTGTLILNGQPLSSYSRPALSRMVSLVPQLESIPFDYTVLDYILLGRTPHLGFFEMPGAADVQAVLDVLRRLDLEHLAGRSVNAISGGERQLVLIARALAQEARILLLDEPTAHLDLANKKRVLSLMHSLAKDGMTVIFTTHDPESASVIAESVILMRKGRIMCQGTINQTFTSELLSQTYDTSLSVIDQSGQKVVLLNLKD